MDQAWDRGPGPRPSTARIRVRELSWQGLHNPCPQSQDPGGHGRDHGKQLLEEYLSPARLHALAQADDLGLVSRLELRVNTRENSLGNFGVHLPNLSQLKLNGSCLGSLRDLGTSLGRLQVLWLARCGLADLDGVSSFPALKELYVSYNDISDLSPLCLLEQLEVLDLEGNCVEDPGQLCYLQLCPRLATLTLEGNPVCLRPGPGSSNEVCAHRTGQGSAAPARGPPAPQGYDYRAEVRQLIPQLQVLDEVPAVHPGLPTSWKLDQDWLMVKEAIKEGSALDSLLPRLVAATIHLASGTGRVLCGNPSKGLQERRHQGQAWVHPEKLPPYRPEGLATRASSPAPDPADSCDLLARLQALRELCMRPLPHRCLESQKAVATVPGGPQRGPEEQEDKAGPKTPPRPSSLGTEPSRTVGYNLIPSPPKSLMSPDRGSSSLGSTDLQFRGRRLRALGSLGPGQSGGLGLGRGLAAVSALRALEVASGSSPSAKGRPGPKPAPDPAARPPASSACRT
ncbi:Leucine-rich repeat-containing protein 56 [Camelus dromedarius]|uniref:Leucine-rich repeat-containing protein 56 n=1 Tax=Camelus dromedarius TaxID=9838 RepID=A0A5N4BYG1_CAMDR|nr:Leucine-rich repeat-containing protein 56 [Camelus dromedarius]